VTLADSERLLDTYDTLARTTGCMLNAAQSGDWDRLVSLEKDCAALIAELAILEDDDPLPRDVRPRKAALIRKVLADDRAIREITEPWMKRLEAQLMSNRREQHLLRTYGPPPMS
jgi:flagellar protein FliT